MKKLLTIASTVVAFGLMTVAFAATTTVRGYVMDQKCSTNPAMKGNVSCAQSCLKSGQPAVLVEDGSGKILSISNKAAIMKVAGHHVLLTGTVTDGAITVTRARIVPVRRMARKAARKAS